MVATRLATPSLRGAADDEVEHFLFAALGTARLPIRLGFGNLDSAVSA